MSYKVAVVGATGRIGAPVAAARLMIVFMAFPIARFPDHSGVDVGAPILE